MGEEVTTWTRSFCWRLGQDDAFDLFQEFRGIVLELLVDRAVTGMPVEAGSARQIRLDDRGGALWQVAEHDQLPEHIQGGTGCSLFTPAAVAAAAYPSPRHG